MKAMSSSPLSAASLVRRLRGEDSPAWLNTVLRTRSAPLLDALAAHVSDGRYTAGDLQRVLVDTPGSVTVHPRSSHAAGVLATVWATGGESAALAAAYPLFRAVVDQVGAHHLTHDQRYILAQSAYHLGDLEGAARALEEFTDLEPDARWALRTDLLNPTRVPGSHEAWLAELSAPFTGAGLAGLSVEPGASAPFDGLSAEPGESVDGPLVSVIMPCFRPDEGLLTSVRSILAQTHANLEVLLVDDASGPEYAPLFDRCAALDSRVRLLRHEVNGGTYVARNNALREARGEFVTVQDADDWSHPRRLAEQVRLLRGSPELAASRSDAVRATDDLVLQWIGFLPRRRNASSLMFRRSLLDTVGPFDTVRKGADSEYFERIRHLAGPVGDTSTPLAVTRLRLGTLSRSDFGYGRMAPDRVLYQSAYRTWHRTLTRGSAPAVGEGPRPFATPPSFQRPGSARVEPRDVDVLLVLDGSHETASDTALDLLDELVGRRVGVLLLEDVTTPRVRQPLPRRPLMSALNAGAATLLSTMDPVRAHTAVFLSPNVLAVPPTPRPPLTAQAVLALAPATDSRSDVVDVLGARDGAEGWFGQRPTWCAVDTDAQDRWHAAGWDMPVLTVRLGEIARR